MFLLPLAAFPSPGWLLAPLTKKKRSLLSPCCTGLWHPAHALQAPSPHSSLNIQGPYSLLNISSLRLKITHHGVLLVVVPAVSSTYLAGVPQVLKECIHLFDRHMKFFLCPWWTSETGKSHSSDVREPGFEPSSSDFKSSTLSITREFPTHWPPSGWHWAWRVSKTSIMYLLFSYIIKRSPKSCLYSLSSWPERCTSNEHNSWTTGLWWEDLGLQEKDLQRWSPCCSHSEWSATPAPTSESKTRHCNHLPW